MEGEKIVVDGKSFVGFAVATPHTTVLLIRAPRGILGCGYFAVGTAEKVGDPLAVVSGVSSFDDMLNASVKAVSSAAAELGVRPGISGREALLLMA